MIQQCLIGQEAIDEEEAHANEDFDLDEDRSAPTSQNEYIQKKNKSIEIASDLMVKIVIQDLKREPYESKTLKFLKTFDSSSHYGVNKDLNEEEKSFLQIQIVVKLLNYFLKNPQVQQEYGDGSILMNLNMIIQNLDQLMPDNPLIVLKTLKLINSMAFKNTMEVRRQMKTLKMFDLRDELIIRNLQNLSKSLVEIDD